MQERGQAQELWALALSFCSALRHTYAASQHATAPYAPTLLHAKQTQNQSKLSQKKIFTRENFNHHTPYYQS